ncbi:flippase [Mucilaginibacter terrenus]|uniref:flippase n=1 Tax=Mucilaginibacter terrenus TaxID=2482727 RepID=UPI0014034EFC|nr:flippase [Mucilaginibacter terrenus]
MSTTKSNYVFNLLLTIVNLIFPIISFPYAARILGPVGIGKVQFITSFAQYFALVAALGIPIYGIREIAKVQNDRERLNRTFSELTLIYVFTSVIISVVYLGVILIVDKFRVDQSSYIVSAGIILLGFSSIDWFYSGIERFKVIAVRSVIIKAISLLLLYLFVKKPSDVFTYLIINIFALVGNNLISMLLVWKDVTFTTKELNFIRHLKPLFFIFSTSLASSMYTLLDVVILGFLSDERAVGFYSAGVKLAKITIPFVTSLGVVAMPKISFSLKEGDMSNFYNLLDKSFRFIAFISIPIAFGLFLLSHEAVVIFSGDKFLQATGVMRILSIMPIIIGFGYFFGIQILISSAKDKQMLISVTVGMIVSVVMNFLLIPFLNEIGAAIANIVSEVFVTLTYMYFVKKYFNFKVPYKSLWQALLSSIIFVPITIMSRYLIGNMIFHTVIAVVTCAISYAVIQQVFFKNELSVWVYEALIKKFKSIKQ